MPTTHAYHSRFARNAPSRYAPTPVRTERSIQVPAEALSRLNGCEISTYLSDLLQIRRWGKQADYISWGRLIRGQRCSQGGKYDAGVNRKSLETARRRRKRACDAGLCETTFIPGRDFSSKKGQYVEPKTLPGPTVEIPVSKIQEIVLLTPDQQRVALYLIARNIFRRRKPVTVKEIVADLSQSKPISESTVRRALKVLGLASSPGRGGGFFLRLKLVKNVTPPSLVSVDDNPVSCVSSPGRSCSAGTPSRTRDESASVPRPGGKQDLRGDNLPECSPSPQDAVTAGQLTEDAQGPVHPAGSDTMRPVFALQRGWTKPGKTALDLLALHAAMTHQAADPRMTRHVRFWLMRAGGYAKVAALIVWACEHWHTLQESLDLLDQEPTLAAVYDYRAAIAALMDGSRTPERPQHRRCLGRERRRFAEWLGERGKRRSAELAAEYAERRSERKRREREEYESVYGAERKGFYEQQAQAYGTEY